MSKQTLVGNDVFIGCKNLIAPLMKIMFIAAGSVTEDIPKGFGLLEISNNKIDVKRRKLK